MGIRIWGGGVCVFVWKVGFLSGFWVWFGRWFWVCCLSLNLFLCNGIFI